MTQLTTVNGFDYYEVTSALQKSIRRSLEEETVFWGIELFESGYVGHLWNRLFIIAHEDIGLADPYFTQKLIALKTAYDYLELKRPKKLSKRLVLLQTLIMFARSKKSRYIDLAYSVYWSEHNTIAKKKQIPDYAFDCHTRKGKAMGRGTEHFYKVGALLGNKAEIQGEAEFEKLAMEIDKKQDEKQQLDEPDAEPPQTIQGSIFDAEEYRTKKRDH